MDHGEPVVTHIIHDDWLMFRENQGHTWSLKYKVLQTNKHRRNEVFFMLKIPLCKSLHVDLLIGGLPAGADSSVAGLSSCDLGVPCHSQTIMQ